MARLENGRPGQDVMVVENRWACDAVRLGPTGGDAGRLRRTLAPAVEPVTDSRNPHRRTASSW